MSVFEKGLNMYKTAARDLKEIEDEPIAEEISFEESSKPIVKKNAIDEIKAQAREKAAKEMQESSNTRGLLEKFKKFLSREKRNKMISLCEREDSGKVGYITMMAFNRVLKNMGFRLLFDEVKTLIMTLAVYNENKDTVFYYKVISAAFRKLYRRDPYEKPPKPSQLQAVLFIQKCLKERKQKRMLKLKLTKESITPKDILNGLAQKIHNSGKPLLRIFEDIDKDHSGFIDVPELHILFQEYGVDLNKDQLIQVFKLIDKDNIGKINYRNLLKSVENFTPTSTDILGVIAISKEEKEKTISEIVSSMKIIFKNLKMTPENMFKFFDKENTGYIGFDAFLATINKISADYTQFQIKQVFQYIDTSHDGQINFREFGRVFFDLTETPAEILKRQELEKKTKLEEELKKKWQDEDNRRKDSNVPVEVPIINLKPSIQDEIKKKQLEAEEEIRKETLRKLDPMFAMKEEAKKREMEAEEKKKKELEEKKKKEEEEKQAKLKLAKALQNVVKPKPEEKKKPALTGKRSGSVTSSSRSKAGKRPAPVKKTLDEKASKLLQVPTESLAVTKVYSRELMEMMKKEFIYPLITHSISHGDSILLARKAQSQFENRAVIKHVYKYAKDWSQEVLNPMPRTVWVSGSIGRIGFIDDQGYLNQLDLITGSAFPVLHLGTKPPFQRIPLLAAVCDSNIGRLYLLNKQWIIEVWELHQNTTSPRKRIKVVSKIIADDYVEKFYKNRYREVFPKLMSISDSGKIIVNATCVDGFLYCFEPVSLTLYWRLRLTLKELRIPEPVLKAFEEFSYFIRECAKLGISGTRVFQLLDSNGDGVLSYEELVTAIKENKLPLSENQIKAMFKAMDSDMTGSISINEFWGGIYMRNQEVMQREAEMKDLIQIPQWVTNVNANERAKEILYKLHRAIENKGLTTDTLFKSIDLDKGGTISRSEFSKGILGLLSPLITSSDIDLLVQIADKDNSGTINYKEFVEFLSLKKLSPGTFEKVNSKELPRDSIKYVIHKCLEMNIDLYKICREKDKSGAGTLPKEVMSSILLWLPIGLTARHLKIITERDFMYSSNGQVDYQEIFEREEYLKLLKSVKRPGVNLEEPLVQEEAAVIEDFEYLEPLGLVAFSTTNPISSIIYGKHINGHLVSKFVGHFGDQPPVLMYVNSANVLVSGERRDIKPIIGPSASLPPCEIMLWNLQKDLIDKFQFNPPWTVKPYAKVYAHDNSIVDLAYLPITQLIVSTAVDGLIKMWTPTGTPYSLTESHNLPIAVTKPGVYSPLKAQFTSANALMACVGIIKASEKNQCHRLISNVFEHCEWLVLLQLVPSTSKSISGSIEAWGFKRLNLSVPVKQHDWQVPSKIHEELFNLFEKHRLKSLSEYRAGLALRLEKIVSTHKIEKTFEKEIKVAMVRSIIFETNYENALKMIVVLPNRIKKGKVSLEEFYHSLVSYAGFGSIPYAEYLRILNGIAEKIAKNPPVEKKKPGLGFISLIKMIEEKKNPGLKALPQKTKESLITSIKNVNKSHEDLFETKTKDLDQELFEFLAARLMEKRVSVSQIFEAIDKDQNGLITIDELDVFLKQIGYNLRKSEVKSIMKCIDANSDETISYKELLLKLKAYGYNEEWKPLTYSHEWEDSSLIHFFKNFEKKNQFRDIVEYLKFYDYNKDGSLTTAELRNALHSVDKSNTERIMNIVLVYSKNQMSIESLVKAISLLEKEIPKGVKSQINYQVMQECLEKFNSLQVLRTIVEDFGVYCLNLNEKTKRGLELIAKQYRISEGLQLLSSGIIRFQELLDYLYAISLSRINNEGMKNLISQEFNVLFNSLPMEMIATQKLDASDFKVNWETEVKINENISQFSGTLLPDFDEILVTTYSPEGLKYVSRDGTSLYNHLLKELNLHTVIQNRTSEITKLKGYHEKHVGLDKAVFAVYDRTPGISLENLISNNGGLLKIPLLYNTKVSIYLFKYWGRKILTILQTLQSYSISIRCIQLKDFQVSKDGLEIVLTSLKGIGIIDSSGKIVSAPDLKVFFNEDLRFNPFVPPEFYLGAHQTAFSDIWSFGAVMYSLLFGHSPTSYLEKYKKWAENKYFDSKFGENMVLPSKSFCYNVYDEYEILNGRANILENSGLGMIKSLRVASFTGIVREIPAKSEIDEIEEIYKSVKDLKNTKPAAANELGKILDIVSMCMQFEPSKRPSVKALLNSPLFSLDKYEEKQAKSFAQLIFEHKNPEICITANITKPLNALKLNFTVENSEEIINLIEEIGNSLLNFEENINLNTTNAISATNLSAKDKEAILKKRLNSPITELANTAIKDEVFSTLCYLSLNLFHLGENSVLLSFANLLKYLLFHLNSEESGLSSLVSTLTEVLLKLFIGEDTCLSSKSPVSGYVLKESFWRPELYEIMGPIYKQSISESGYGQHNCPVIKDYLTKNRHPDYFSELLMLAENFNLVRKPESTTVSKRNALRHIKSMLQTKNEFKTLAALDFKLPQMIIHCVQDPDYKVRAEAIEIFLFFAEGCIEPLLPRLPGVNKNYRSLGIINFFSIAKKQTHETTKNFEKFSMIQDSVPQSIKDLSCCFQSPIFIFPIVRLIKFKSEPFETKENAAKVLIFVLQGSEKCQLAALSPISDTILTLCKCLVVNSKTTDKKSNKSLSGTLKSLLGVLLDNARSYILASFKNTPGAEALLKEQGLMIPEKVTLQSLYSIKPPTPSLESNIRGLVQGLKNWLVHERVITSSNPKEQSVVTECFDFLQSSVNFYWEIADVLPPSERVFEASPLQIKIAREKINLILMFFEWALHNDLDFAWFKVEKNVHWLIGLTTRAIQSSGSDFEVFLLEQEGLVCQRILCRILAKEKSNVLLGKLKFGIAFAEQLEMQYNRLIKVIAKHTEPLHVLQFYAANSDIRLATFCNLLQFNNLQAQFLDTEFMEVLVRDFLSNYQVLSARFNKLSLEFLPFRDTPPVRSEAINIIIMILKEKNKCKVVYDDLLLHLQRHKVIQNEIINAISANPVIQSTALELLQNFICSEDSQIEYLMMQGNAKETFKNIIEHDTDIKLRFPVIYNYCK